MIIHLFDLVGTVAFAFVGAQFALSHRLNTLGVIVCASLTAVGGGTIRELLLQHTPFYFYDYTYLIAIIIGIAFALGIYKRLIRIKTVIVLLEALGTIIFAFNGAYAAIDAQLGLAAVLVFAGVTAFGGGLLCDVIVRQKPRIFCSSISTIPSLLLGAGCWLAGSGVNNIFVMSSLLICAYSAQLVIVSWPHLVQLFGRPGGLQIKQPAKRMLRDKLSDTVF